MNHFWNIKAWCWGVLIWGSMYIHGLGLVCKVEGCLNQDRYHEILENKMVCRIIPMFHLDPSCVIFQQVSAPIHTTKMLQ